MKKLLGVISAAALLAGIGLARPALADDPYAPYVGGGAAAVSAGTLLVYKDATDPIGAQQYESAGATETEPAVTMGAYGGGEFKSTYTFSAFGITVENGQVGIHGSRGGYPYAQGWAHLQKVDINLPGAPELTFNSINADCNWTQDGASGGATIEQGTLGIGAINPAPNTNVPLPGIGYATLNEVQDRWTYLPSPSGPTIGHVISVAGMHIHLNAALSKTFGQSDIYLALALCDPTKIINVSGIGVGPYTPANSGGGGGG